MLLDLFPLNSVIFPYQKMSLRIFEPRYIRLIGECHREARSFGVCMIRDGKEVGAPAIPVEIGTSAVIREFTDIADNLFYIVVQGERRFRIEHVVQEQPHITAEIEWIDDEVPSFPGDYSLLRKIITDIVKDRCKIPEENSTLIGLMGELMAAYPGEKQKILELPKEEILAALINFLKSI